jgi:hypothetical protein
MGGKGRTLLPTGSAVERDRQAEHGVGTELF